jgi:hypothetical protein
MLEDKKQTCGAFEVEYSLASVQPLDLLATLPLHLLVHPGHQMNVEHRSTE